MKKILICLLFCGLAATTAFAAEPQKDEYREVMQEMLELPGTKQSYDVMMDQVISMLDGMNGDPKVMNELKKAFQQSSIEKLWDMLTPVYKAHISLEDMRAMRDFYKTPAGQRISTATPAITAASVDISMQWAMELVSDMMETMK